MIYLDNASTSDNCQFLSGKFANPNSPHALGNRASEFLEGARNRVKNVLGVSSGEVIFGGTTSMLIERLKHRLCEKIESNIAIDFCSKYEHDCIADNTFMSIDFNNDFQLYNERCFIYAHIHTNNITGRVYDIDCYGRKIRENGDFFIVDTTATWGHTFVPEHIEEWCDCVVGSAHKFYGTEGTGFMWLSDRFLYYLYPCCTVTKKDEYGFWPGTPAVTNIHVMVNCLEFFNDEVAEKQKVWEKLTNILLEELKENNIKCSIVDCNKPKTWAINALTLPGFDGEALVQYLSGKEIYISAGHSACANEGDYRVLKACGLPEKEAKSTVRISFGYSTTEEQVKELAKEIVNFKNKFM